MDQDKDLDPGVTSALTHSRGAEKKELAPYQKKKRRYDAERDRMRVDLDSWLREDVIAEAERQNMSWSQFAAFLMAYGLYKWVSGDDEIHQFFAQAKTEIASLRWRFALILDDLRDLVRKSAR